MGTFVKIYRGPTVDALLADPNGFALLAYIALHARRTPGTEQHNGVNVPLQTGEAFIEGAKTLGLSDKAYRKAKERLQSCKFGAFKRANKGTVGSLVNSEVFDINELEGASKRTNKGRTRGEQESESPITTGLSEPLRMERMLRRPEEVACEDIEAWREGEVGNEGGLRKWYRTAPDEYWETFKKEFPSVSDPKKEAERILFGRKPGEELVKRPDRFLRWHFRRGRVNGAAVRNKPRIWSPPAERK